MASQLLKVFLAFGCEYTQSLATTQNDRATELHEAFSSPFGHLHKS